MSTLAERQRELYWRFYFQALDVVRENLHRKKERQRGINNVARYGKKLGETPEEVYFDLLKAGCLDAEARAGTGLE